MSDTAIWIVIGQCGHGYDVRRWLVCWRPSRTDADVVVDLCTRQARRAWSEATANSYVLTRYQHVVAMRQWMFDKLYDFDDGDDTTYWCEPIFEDPADRQALRVDGQEFRSKL